MDCFEGGRGYIFSTQSSPTQSLPCLLVFLSAPMNGVWTFLCRRRPVIARTPQFSWQHFLLLVVSCMLIVQATWILLIQLSHAQSIQSRKARKHSLACQARFAQSCQKLQCLLLGWSLLLVCCTLSLNILSCRCVSMMWFYCTSPPCIFLRTRTRGKMSASGGTG